MELRHRNGSLYISGVGAENKEIKIPSQMFPLNSKPAFICYDNTDNMVNGANDLHLKMWKLGI